MECILLGWKGLSRYMCGVQGQPPRADSLLPQCKSRGLNSGPSAQRQMSLPTVPSHWPPDDSLAQSAIGVLGVGSWSHSFRVTSLRAFLLQRTGAQGVLWLPFDSLTEQQAEHSFRILPPVPFLEHPVSLVTFAFQALFFLGLLLLLLFMFCHLLFSPSFILSFFHL